MQLKIILCAKSNWIGYTYADSNKLTLDEIFVKFMTAKKTED